MASFQKRGKTWQYTISRYLDGKYSPIRKGGFRTKKEAQIAAAKKEAELATGKLTSDKPVVFRDYFEQWTKLYKMHVAKATKEHYESTLRYIGEHFGDKTIQQITRNDYQLLLNVYGQKYSKETMNKVNGHIRACVENAIEDGIIAYNFTRKAVVTGIPGKKKEDNFWSLKIAKNYITSFSIA